MAQMHRELAALQVRPRRQQPLACPSHRACSYFLSPLSLSLQANSQGQQRLGQSEGGLIDDVNEEGSSEDQSDHDNDEDDDDNDANEGGSGGVVRFEAFPDTQRTQRVGGGRKPQSRRAVAPSGGKSSSAQLAACRSEVAK